MWFTWFTWIEVFSGPAIEPGHYNNIVAITIIDMDPIDIPLLTHLYPIINPYYPNDISIAISHLYSI